MKFSVQENKQIIDQIRNATKNAEDLKKFDAFIAKNPTIDIGNSGQMDEIKGSGGDYKCPGTTIELHGHLHTK
ncbi:MAG: hypothetical protein PHG67_13910 [Bacteroidales bacterium]|jgi:hypothetical protein|nr:hypothetical protein [Bacteroidales bacterium]